MRPEQFQPHSLRRQKNGQGPRRGHASALLFILLLAIPNSVAGGETYHEQVISSPEPGQAAAAREKLEADHPNVRAEVLRKLGKSRPVTPEGLSAFKAALVDESPYIRETASRVIAAETSLQGEALMLILLQQVRVKSEEPFTRANILKALGQMKAQAKDITPTLVQLAEAESESMIVRVHALRALGTLGEAAQAAIPALQGLAGRDASVLIQTTTWETLARIQPTDQEVIQQLVRVAQGEFGEIFPIKDGISSTSLDVLSSARKTLVQLDKAAEVLPLLIGELDHLRNAEQSKAQERALQAISLLGEMGPAAQPAVPALIDLLETLPSSQLGQVALPYLMGSLLQIHPSSAEVQGALQQIATTGKTPTLRAYAHGLYLWAIDPGLTQKDKWEAASRRMKDAMKQRVRETVENTETQGSR